jgi:hypothetical protein
MGGWTPGEVIGLHYKEPNWSAPVPYQVLLDDQGEIYAPEDTDSYIRKPRQAIQDKGKDERKSTGKEVMGKNKGADRQTEQADQEDGEKGTGKKGKDARETVKTGKGKKREDRSTATAGKDA